LKIVVDGLPYAVVVSTDSGSEVARALSGEQARAFVVADKSVASRAQEIGGHLRGAGCDVAGEFFVRAGEQYKRWSSVAELHQRFVEAALDRDSIVVAVGGGTLTDVAGFAAATYLRGLRWLPIATSLTGMVDAALGGKTGVNLPQGKNLVGAMWQPLSVIADVEALATLPKAALRDGFAEMVKSAIIGDPSLLVRLETIEKASSSQAWAPLIASAAAVKVRAVAQDPHDRGSRAVLNLGHTVAHALERVSKYRLSHGTAVAVGLRAAGILARDRTGWSYQDHRRVVKALARMRLRVRLWRLPLSDILAAMNLDKKRRLGSSRFVLPVRLGEVRTGVEVSDDDVARALEELTHAPAAGTW
jgi:3-dehydroquinate synthase